MLLGVRGPLFYAAFIELFLYLKYQVKDGFFFYCASNFNFLIASPYFDSDDDTFPSGTTECTRVEPTGTEEGTRDRTINTALYKYCFRFL